MAGIEALFAAEYPRLVRALAVAFGEAAAADAVQEAFIEADRHWRKVSSLDDPAAWVRRVALNRLLNRSRDARRRAEILASASALEPSMVRSSASETNTDELLDLRAALHRLPQRMRAAVVLFYLADLSIEQVAVSMQVEPGTVKSTLHDARRRLRGELAREDDDQ